MFQKRMKRFMKMLKGISLLVMFGMVVAVLNSPQTVLANKEEKPMFEFGIVPDAQYCNCNRSGTRFYQNSLEKLSEASQIFNEHKLRFTIQLGDLIDRDYSSFSSILPIYNSIESKKYHVLGNHDFAASSDEVVKLLSMPNQYYDFKYKNWRFIVLDSNDLSFYANSKGSLKYKQAEEMYHDIKAKGAINAQTWNGGLSEEQLKWLRNTLDKSAKRNEKVIVFSHMPVYPKNEHNIWNDELVKKELEAAGNVVAFFNGHNHAGNYGVSNGNYYVNFKGMVETEDTNSFSILKVYKNRIEIDGFGLEEDRVLKIKK